MDFTLLFMQVNLSNFMDLKARSRYLQEKNPLPIQNCSPGIFEFLVRLLEAVVVACSTQGEEEQCKIGVRNSTFGG